MDRKIIAKIMMSNHVMDEWKGDKYITARNCKRCGSKPILYSAGDTFGNAMVQCPHCEFEIEVNEWLMSYKYDPMQEAISLWNYFMNKS